MAGIFISYRRQESTKDARSLYERLRAEFGHDQVFIDLEGLDYGVDFVESLDAQLQDCQVLLALVGPHWLTAQDGRGRRRLDDPNDFVLIEVRTALERGIRVVPVLVWLFVELFLLRPPPFVVDFFLRVPAPPSFLVLRLRVPAPPDLCFPAPLLLVLRLRLRHVWLHTGSIP